MICPDFAWGKFTIVGLLHTENFSTTLPHQWTVSCQGAMFSHFLIQSCLFFQTHDATGFQGASETIQSTQSSCPRQIIGYSFWLGSFLLTLKNSEPCQLSPRFSLCVLSYSGSVFFFLPHFESFLFIMIQHYKCFLP